MPILWKDDVNLFPAMGLSKRFGEMKATKYVNKINVDQESKKMILETLSGLFKIAKDNFFEEHPKVKR